MDKEIFDRYRKSESPFNEKVLYTNVTIPLDKLRRIVEQTLRFLKENQLLNGKVYKVWDWFEHDGYLHPKEIITEDFWTQLTRDNDEFYRNRSGDTYVKLGLYDGFSRWYLRIYIIDEYDLKEGDEIGGTFDFSSNEVVIQSLIKYLGDKGYDELQSDEVKMYFEKRYAGI